MLKNDTIPEFDPLLVCQSMFNWIKQTYPNLTGDDMKTLWERTSVAEVNLPAGFLNLITKACPHSNARKRSAPSPLHEPCTKRVLIDCEQSLDDELDEDVNGD